MYFLHIIKIGNKIDTKIENILKVENYRCLNIYNIIFNLLMSN